jgi:hypothetical protein
MHTAMYIEYLFVQYHKPNKHLIPFRDLRKRLADPQTQLGVHVAKLGLHERLCVNIRCKSTLTTKNFIHLQ